MHYNIYFIGALLALIGGAFSFYFNGVYYGKILPHQFWIPQVCQMDSNQCTSIVETKYGKIFGVPNAQLGRYFLFGYSLTLAGVPFNLVDPLIPLFIGGLTIFLGIYLVYGLIRLKTPCSICLTIHVLNAVIFIIQLI